MRGGGEAADTHWPLFMLVRLLFRKQNKTKQKTHHVQTLCFFCRVQLMDLVAPPHFNSDKSRPEIGINSM